MKTTQHASDIPDALKKNAANYYNEIICNGALTTTIYRKNVMTKCKSVLFRKYSTMIYIPCI